MARRCSVVGCEKPHKDSGLCAMHKARQERHGNAEYEPPNYEQRFMKYVNKQEDGCWIWTGAETKGYGKFRIGKTNLNAQRASWILFRGVKEEIKGKNVCHTCDTPLCVNPEHLFVGTTQDNVDDKMKKGRYKPVVGVNQKNAKLDDDKVRQIRAGIMTIRAMAKHFGVSLSLIKEIRSGKRWKHVV
jgi:HNH endonuclease